MKYIGFPIKMELKNLKNKKLKKLKNREARAPESSKAQQIPGQHQGPAVPDQRILTPDNAIWPQTRPYSTKYQGFPLFFLCLSYASMVRYRQISMKYIGFPIKMDSKKLKSLKK